MNSNKINTTTSPSQNKVEGVDQMESGSSMRKPSPRPSLGDRLAQMTTKLLSYLDQEYGKRYCVHAGMYECLRKSLLNQYNHIFGSEECMCSRCILQVICDYSLMMSLKKESLYYYQCDCSTCQMIEYFDDDLISETEHLIWMFDSFAPGSDVLLQVHDLRLSPLYRVCVLAQARYVCDVFSRRRAKRPWWQMTRNTPRRVCRHYPEKHLDFCCDKLCFKIPKDQVDGISCEKCLNYSYCVCSCLSYRDLEQERVEQRLFKRSISESIRVMKKMYQKHQIFNTREEEDPEWYYPQAPTKSTVTKRLHSYPRWVPNYEKTYKAYAGFEYYGPGKDKCVMCGLVLTDWLPNDNAYEEHRKWSPNCPLFELNLIDALEWEDEIVPLTPEGDERGEIHEAKDGMLESESVQASNVALQNTVEITQAIVDESQGNQTSATVQDMSYVAPNLTDQWMRLPDLTWSTSSNGIIATYDLPYDVLENNQDSAVIRLFENHAFFRSDMKVRAYTNANNFQQGMLIMAFKYYYTEEDVHLITDPRELLELPHIIINLHSQNPGELIIPFCSPLSYIPIRDMTYDTATETKSYPLLDGLYYGRLFVGVLAPLQTGADGKTSVSISSFVSLENCEFTGKRDRQPVFVSPSRKAPEGILGIVGDIASTVGSVIGGLGSAFNLDRPPHAEDGKPIIQRSVPYLSAGDGEYTGIQMKLNPEVTTSWDHSQMPDPSQFDLNFIKKVEGYQDLVTVSSAATVGSVIYRTTIYPGDMGFDLEASEVRTLRHITPVSHLCNYFAFVSGGFRIKTRVAMTPQHSVRLRYSFVPLRVLNGTYDYKNQYSVVYDLNEQTEFIFEIPNQIPQYNTHIQSIDELTINGHTQFNLSTYSIGELYITLETELVYMESVANNIQLLLTFMGADNLQFSVPMSRARYRIESPSRKTPEGDERVEERNEESVLPGNTISSASQAGEISNVFNCSRRFQHYITTIYDNVSTERSQPCYRFNVNTNSYVEEHGTEGDRYGMSFAELMSTGFRFFRGSIRYNITLETQVRQADGTYERTDECTGFYVMNIPMTNSADEGWMQIGGLDANDLSNRTSTLQEVVKMTAYEYINTVNNNTISVEVPYQNPHRYILTDVTGNRNWPVGNIGRMYVFPRVVDPTKQYRFKLTIERAMGDGFHYYCFQGFPAISYTSVGAANQDHRFHIVRQDRPFASEAAVETYLSPPRGKPNGRAKRAKIPEGCSRESHYYVELKEMCDKLHIDFPSLKYSWDGNVWRCTFRGSFRNKLFNLDECASIKKDARELVCMMILEKVPPIRISQDFHYETVNTNGVPVLIEAKTPEWGIFNSWYTPVTVPTHPIWGGMMSSFIKLTNPDSPASIPFSFMCNTHLGWLDVAYHTYNNVGEFIKNAAQTILDQINKIFDPIAKLLHLKRPSISLIPIMFDVYDLYHEQNLTNILKMITNILYQIGFIDDGAYATLQAALRLCQPYIERYTTASEPEGVYRKGATPMYKFCFTLATAISGAMGFAKFRDEDFVDMCCDVFSTICRTSNPFSHILELIVVMSDEFLNWWMGEKAPDFQKVRELQASSESMGKWAEKVVTVCSGQNALHITDSPQLKREVISLYLEGVHYLPLISDAEPAVSSKVLTFFNMIKTKYDEMESTGMKYESMYDPFCLYMSGPRGLGKSSSAHDVIIDLLMSMNVVYEYDPIYTVSPETDFWNGYVGQPALLIDDFFLIQDSETVSRMTKEICTIKSPVEFNVNKAAISEKNTYCLAKMMCILSNFPYPNPNCLEKTEGLQAFWRRRNALIHCEFTPEFKKLLEDKGFKTVNSAVIAKFPEWFDDEHPNYRGKHSHLQFKILNSEQITEPDQIREVMDYKNLIKYLRKQVKTHNQLEMKRLIKRFGVTAPLSMKAWEERGFKPYHDKLSEIAGRFVEAVETTSSDAEMPGRNRRSRRAREITHVDSDVEFPGSRASSCSRATEMDTASEGESQVCNGNCMDGPDVSTLLFDSALSPPKTLRRISQTGERKNGVFTPPTNLGWTKNLHDCPHKVAVVTTVREHYRMNVTELNSKNWYNPNFKMIYDTSLTKPYINNHKVCLFYNLTEYEIDLTHCEHGCAMDNVNFKEMFVLFYYPEPFSKPRIIHEFYEMLKNLKNKAIQVWDYVKGVCMNERVLDLMYLAALGTLIKGFFMAIRYFRGEKEEEPVKVVRPEDSFNLVSLGLNYVSAGTWYDPGDDNLKYNAQLDEDIDHNRLKPLHVDYQSIAESRGTSSKPKTTTKVKFSKDSISSNLKPKQSRPKPKFPHGDSLSPEQIAKAKRVFESKQVSKPRPELKPCNDSEIVLNKGRSQYKAEMSEDTLNKLKRVIGNQIILYLRYKDESKNVCTHAIKGLGIKGKVCVFPWHLVHELMCMYDWYNEGGWYFEVVMMSRRTLQFESMAMVPVADCKFERMGTLDLCACKLKTLPMMFSDIVSSFISESTYNGINYDCLYLYETQLLRSGVTANLMHSVEAKPHIEYSYYDFDLYDEYFNIIGFVYNFRGDGVCGSLLIDFRNFKILGMHTTGGQLGRKSVGYSMLMCKEMLERICSEELDPPDHQSLVVAEAPVISECETWTGNFVTYGRVKKKASLNCTTDIEKSPLSPFMCPPIKIPAMLNHETDPQNHPGYAVLSAAMTKSFAPPPIPFNPNTLSTAKDVLRQLLISKVKPISKDITVDFETAVCGVVGEKFLDPLKKDTSNGYPYNTMGMTDKYDCFEYGLQDGKVVLTGIKPQFKQIYDTNRSMREQGKVPPTAWYAFLKDERVKIEKATKLGGTRVIDGSPIDLTIDQRRILMNFACAFKNTRFDMFHGIGMNVESYEWDELARRLLEKGSHIVDGDYSGFGPGIPSWILYHVYDLIYDWIVHNGGLNEIDEKVFRCVVEENCSRATVVGDALVHEMKGSPSGNALTDILNSIANLLYLICSLLEVYFKDRGDYHDMFNMLYLCVYGDDFIMSMNADLAKRATPKQLSEWFAKHNIKLTPAEKSAKHDGYLTLDNATFLQRHFVRFNNIWHAGLEQSVLQDIPNWVNNRVIDMESHLQDLCMNVLRGAVSWGAVYYLRVSRRVSQIAQERGWTFVVPTFSSFYAYVYDETRTKLSEGKAILRNVTEICPSCMCTYTHVAGKALKDEDHVCPNECCERYYGLSDEILNKFNLIDSQYIQPLVFN
nr:MAG: polyprotein [Iflaviridae sp.]